MTRKLLALITAILGSVLLAAPASAAPPNVGQHIHVEVSNHPVDGFPIAKAPYTFHVVIKLHAFAAGVQYLRIDDSSTTRATLKFNPALTCATSDCSFPFDWTVDFSSWATGRHELRWHADSKDSDPATSGTQRQYTTSRVNVCVGSCSPNVGGRATPWAGGGSWYTGPGYVVALLLSPQSDVKPGGSIVVRSQYSPGKQVCVFLNAAFHDGSSGTTLGCFTGTGNHTVSLAGAAVGDRLLIISIGTQEAGVYEVHVGDGSPQPTAFMAFHSWWARSGLVLP